MRRFKCPEHLRFTPSDTEEINAWNGIEEQVKRSFACTIFGLCHVQMTKAIYAITFELVECSQILMRVLGVSRPRRPKETLDDEETKTTKARADRETTSGRQSDAFCWQVCRGNLPEAGDQ